MQKVTVIGAGFSGCEATWQLVKRNIPVRLIEMRPTKMTPAHKTANFCELVCSNSLRSNQLTNAVGVLKEEMRMLDSLVIKIAEENSIDAGGALAVDRELFSQKMTDFIKNHPLVEVINEEVVDILDGPTIIATGPLTSDALTKKIQALLGEDHFYFYDAAAPIIEKDSIDFNKAYYKLRYDKGEGSYINCPMTKEEFEKFYQEVITAKCAQTKDFEKEIYFEGCMPFEVMAKRGKQTLLFGPMKPVGLEKPDGTRPYAVVQLRQDNAIDTLYNIVGFQTHLTFGEQKRVINLIPGLENASIVRYGVMHRNTYLNSPKHLKETYQFNQRDDLFFAGQMTGVEGYVESAASGLVAGINMARLIKGQELIKFSNLNVIGSMAYYITHASSSNFQPMNANFGIVASVEGVKKNERKEALSRRCLESLRTIIEKYQVNE